MWEMGHIWGIYNAHFGVKRIYIYSFSPSADGDESFYQEWLPILGFVEMLIIGGILNPHDWPLTDCVSLTTKAVN